VEDIDRKILGLLCRDGRISFTELKGYAAVIDPADAGLPLTAFVSIKPFDPAAPDDAPQRLAHLPAIEACHSVAGEENYILKVRVATPTDLEDLLQQIRAAAGVSTRTTIVLSTPYENRPPNL
jgi:Lrp/AsnC family leucine-responsive transcriptional regulator